MDLAFYIQKFRRPVLLVLGSLLLVDGLFSHNTVVQVAGFLIAVYGAFGGG